jgi:hypothetical protein
MKKSIKFLTVLHLLIVSVSSTVTASATHLSVKSSDVFVDTAFKFLFDKGGSARLKRQADKIREYAETNGYSMEYCFLVDMSIPSGKNRFFVYNMRKDSLEFSSLVSHGFGSTIRDGSGTDNLVFSNMPYSFKTSLGKYKVGKPYQGQYGLSYKLYGLDTSNNRALERAIVLHADEHVPTQETYPAKIYQSAGCPTVCPSFLSILGSFIKSSKKPILMWIYD